MQNKLPLINSAHGSETRNIINELIKLFNGMGYTYNEALQKAHDVLNEAKQTNDMNKDVQNQLDNLIIESGNANAEVSQARGGLPLLKDRLDKTDSQLAESTTDLISLTKSLEGGTADVSGALNTLATRVKAEGKNFYVPNGTFYCAEDLVIEGIQNVKIDGEIIMAAGKTLTISYDSRRSFSCNWDINRVVGSIRLAGMKNLKGIVRHVSEELEIFADSADAARSSVAYNEIKMGTINTLRIKGVNNGWINDNKFIGGRLKNFIVEGDYAHNNNTFHDTVLEGFNAEVLTGGNNVFYDCRLEGSCSFYFAEGTFLNKFYRTWTNFAGGYLRSPNPAMEADVTDNGIGNGVVFSYDGMDYEEKTIYELNSHSNNFPVHRILKKETGLEIISLSPTIFETGLINLDGDVGLLALSDKSLFRFRVQFFDENKQLITENPSEYLSSLSMSWSDSNSWLVTSSNRSYLGVAIFKNSPIKYYNLTVMNGTDISGEDFHGLRVFIRHEKRKEPLVPVLSQHKNYHAPGMPTHGYFEEGDYVKNTSLNISGSENQRVIRGWFRLTTGDNHVENVDWVADRVYFGLLS